MYYLLNYSYLLDVFFFENSKILRRNSSLKYKGIVENNYYFFSWILKAIIILGQFLYFGTILLLKQYLFGDRESSMYISININYIT